MLVELQIIIGPILQVLKNKSDFFEIQTLTVIKEVNARHVLSKKSAQQPTSNQGKGADHSTTELYAFTAEYGSRKQSTGEKNLLINYKL